MARPSKGYFSDFPQIEYQSKIARSLMARPKIKDTLLNNPTALYDYTVSDDLRPDQVAYLYYGDSELLWLIFLANNMTDPYYDWPLTQKQFADHLQAKYGSVAEAQAKILHYKHNTKGTIITKDTYDLNGTFGKIVAGHYTAVTAYNYEDELNESKRTIKMIDRRLANDAKNLLREIMIG